MTGQPFDTKSGLARSASLMRALGANAAQVWNELDPADAAALTDIMNTQTDRDDTEAAANDFVAEMMREDEAGSVWAQLSQLNSATLAHLLNDEHPQLIALTLSRIGPEAAAVLVRSFPALLATDILHRMLHMSQPLPVALAAIEDSFSRRLAGSDVHLTTQTDAAVARIIEALPDERGETLLTALHAMEPGANDRIKALMFGFADLADLTAAGMQTLLAKANRATLVLALKGVDGDIADAFLMNMTARAREALQEDIAALGRQRRKDVEAARSSLVALTRHLIEAGDILPTGTDLDQELIA